MPNAAQQLAAPGTPPNVSVPEETFTTRVSILICFLSYFVFCFLVHLSASKVERVALPDINSLPIDPSILKAQSLHIIISNRFEDQAASISCHDVDRQRRHIQANIICHQSDIRLDALSESGIDTYLRPMSSETAQTLFLISDPAVGAHSFILGQYTHAWSFRGRLRAEDWIRSAFAQVERMLPFSPHPISHEVQSQRSYLLSFSVLIEDPGLTPVTWDFKQILSEYLQPFLEEIRPIFNTRIDSQIIFYADIADHVKIDANGSSVLTSSQLEDFMGRTKWNVESIHTPEFPAMHFFLYVPLPKHAPLTIQSDPQNKISNTAFYLPRWGGLVIANSLAKSNATAEDFAPVMPTVLAQIRTLLGFPTPTWAGPSSIEQLPSDFGVAGWEISLIQRQRLHQNFVKGSEQIRQLIKLLDDNHQLPVQWHVGQLLQQAVSNLKSCLVSSASGSYSEAYERCLDGYTAAHSAFYDETMLPLLYFPDEHVYAVYMPYFGPIALPILSRTVQFLKSLKTT